MGRSGKKRQRQGRQSSDRQPLELEGNDRHNQNIKPSIHELSHSVGDVGADWMKQSSGEPTETESRKRSRRQLDFVHPKENGKAKPFVFRQRGKDSRDTKEASGESQSTSSGISSKAPTKKKSNESIDDIFLRRNGEKMQTKALEYESPEHRHSMNEGKLSGLSVEEAVRDKSGCRPRANSTDGELNLPRRGLCDEHIVLQSHVWKQSTQGRSPRGFTNLGNSCFLNSTLQCLAYLPPFCQSLLAMQDRIPAENGKKTSHGKRITLMLRALFQKVETRGGGGGGGGGAIAPRDVFDSLPSLGTCGGRYGGYKFRKWRQEDAHEFLVHLLDAMHDGELLEAGINQRKSGWRDRLPIPRLDETTFVHRIFGGYLRSQLQCPKCKYCSNTYDPFLDLALEVSGKAINSVADAFLEFTRKETLDSDNRWKCGGCGQRVRAKKALTVFRPPLSLCVQMKRFSFGGFNSGFQFKRSFGGGRGNKITKAIAFPAEMKLPLSDNRSCEYALTGVVIHVGGSSDSGHYTAYVKKPGKSKSDQWFHMDDSYVQAVSEKTVLQQRNAYVLFYSRKEVKLEFPSPPPRRASMSAEEATELGRTRARARADSLTLLEVQQTVVSTKKEHIATAEEVASNNATPNKAKDSFQANTADRATAKHLAKSADNNTKTKDSSTAQRAQPKAPEDSSDSSSDSSSSSSSSDDSSDDSESDEEKSNEAQDTRKETPPKQASANSQQTREVPSAESYGATASQSFVTKKAGAESSSTTSSDSESSSSSSESEPEEPVGDATAAPARTVPLSESKKHGSPKPEKPKKKSTAPTRVVLDRGSGREKVSVMVGPRFKNRKGWTPQTSGTTKSGEEYELLGNRNIDKWGDSTDTVEPKVSQARSQIVNTMEKDSRAQKRKMFADRWDASLDRGRVKKVKQKRDVGNAATGPSDNSFQRILTGMQKMKHGRPKGHYVKPQSSKGKKKRR